jgi:Kef-type K+ transport system membrane component KefB/K+/H+ antiporter YhaU regulatory subunit KhtT
MEHASPFVPLLLITVLAVAMPVLVSRIRPVRLPIVVGEIVAGIIIGKSGLNLVQPTPTLDFLAEFGFVFLMFLSGLEVNFGTLSRIGAQDSQRSWLQRPIPLAVTTFGLTTLTALLFGMGFVALGLAQNPILIGLILNATALGIVVPVLKERGITGTIYGQVVLVTALISDFVTLLLFSLTIAVISRGLSLNLLLFLLMLAIFMTVARISQFIRGIPILQRIAEELSHATAQIEVRGAFALMITWVVLAEAFGLEVILGAFLAGAIISVSSQHHESLLREKLDAIGYGFFIPIFFIMVGANFNIYALLGSPVALLLVPLLIGATYLINLLPTLLFRRLFSWRETFAAATLLASRLSLIIAASAIALDLGLIETTTNSAMVLVAVVTCTLSPVLFGRILPPTTEQRRDGVIILGTDQLARLLAERLRGEGEQITFLGHDLARLSQLQQSGQRVVLEDPTEAETLERAGAAEARVLMAVTNAPDIVQVCQLAQEQFRIPIIIARADDPEHLRQLQSLNIRVVQPAMATAMALEGAMRFPAAFNMLMEKSDDVDLLDIPLQNPHLDGMSMRRLRLPGNVLVLGIRREGEVVVPHGDTVLRYGDLLMVVGSPEALSEAHHWLNRRVEVGTP